MSRRRFDHLVQEVSLAVGALVPRYALWLDLHESGADPEQLGPEQAVAYCEGPLLRFLGEHGFWLTPRALRQVIDNVARFDPARPAPEDFFARDEGAR